MTPPISAQVCVIGAGPVGGTLACRLAGAGVRVVVIDQAALPPMAHPAFDGRAYAIAAGSRVLLENAGLWGGLPATPNPIRDIRVSDGRIGRPASRLHLHFDHRQARQQPAGRQAREPEARGAVAPFGWMVEARALRQALNAALRDRPSLQVFAPARASVERSADMALVRLTDGTTIGCQLVIAAEGRDSPLRDQAGIAVTHVPYDQTGIVCAIAHEHPHHDTALEHFLPAGPFAALPMGPSEDAEPGGSPNVSAIVWTEGTRAARTILGLDDDRFLREVARRLGNHLGAVRSVGRRWNYPLSAMHAHRYVDTRLALAGDSAHGIHPIAGQGLNLGFRDAIALSDLIIEANRAGADAGNEALLARYQRLRQSDNLLMLAMTDRLDRLFSTDNRLLRRARDVGIAAVHRSGPLKRLFMRQAMGLTGLR